MHKHTHAQRLGMPQHRAGRDAEAGPCPRTRTQTRRRAAQTPTQVAKHIPPETHKRGPGQRAHSWTLQVAHTHRPAARAPTPILAASEVTGPQAGKGPGKGPRVGSGAGSGWGPLQRPRRPGPSAVSPTAQGLRRPPPPLSHMPAPAGGTGAGQSGAPPP